MASVVRRRLLRGLALLPIAAPLAYLLAAVVLGLIPVNRDFRSMPGGDVVYVRSNGVHAELVLPAETMHTRWPQEFAAAHFRARPAGHDFIAFGWGDRDFMIGTPTWAEFNPWLAFKAFFGLGQGTVHVEYVARPASGEAVRLQLTDAQFGRLAAYVGGSFARDREARPVRIGTAAYGATDAFYASTQTYAPWLTCNEWVRRGLAEAGVRAPLWAPFEAAIFRQLDRVRP